VILAAALREGYRGPVFIQGDHFQVNHKKFAVDPITEVSAVKALVTEAVAAGFYNIDVDTSTLVDLSKETLAEQNPGGRPAPMEDPFNTGTLEKPVIAAVNGFAMGGGFMMVERTDLRVAASTAIFEVSEAKRWLLGGYNHGHMANLAYPLAMEMALGFRFTAERFHQIGFINRVVEPEKVMEEAMGMALHLLTLPPAARVNTVHMMRRMRPMPTPAQQKLAAALHQHGAMSDLIESRAAFAEKRRPNFKGWEDPRDRYRMPQMD
jgi:hypothetical protein